MTQVFDLTTLNGSNGFRISNASWGVSNAGDVNGDGFDDIVVDGKRGASLYDPSYVIFGKNTPFSATFDPSTLNGNNGFQLIHDVYGANRTTTAGDFNGDGFDDLLVAGTTYSDSASIFFGKGTGFSSTESLSTAVQDKNTSISIVGLGSNNNNTISVSRAGDINGDHIDDIILGYAGDGFYQAGSSYVIFGKSNFTSNTIDLGTLNGTNGFWLQGIDGINGKDDLGSSLSGAGDVNGDGYDDLIVGARGGGNNPTNGGSSYVVFGKASGFNAKLEMNLLDGTNGFRLDGVSAFDFAGHSVSNAGDVNGDGFADILIGAPGTDINGDNSGSSYVVFGKASGFGAVVDLGSLNGSNGFAIDGLDGNDQLGKSVSNAGDVNGDGYGDILIGAPGTDHNGSYSGSVYVVFGKSTGFSATLDLANLASNAGFRIDGSAAGNYMGFSVTSVSGAGDINGDGFDDLMVHDLFIDPTSYIIFGRGDFSNLENIIEGTQIGDVLVGTKAAEHFKSGLGNDTINGKGGADIYDAGSGNDLIRISDLNFKLVDGGSGDKDTLAVAAVDANLDLANFSGKITGIERIYLYGQSGSDSGVTLNATQLKALSDTTNKLIVNGNQGDYVHITDDGWQDKGIYNGMHTYANADAQLLVGVNVMVEFV
ncbi:MAG TPA: integrin alpha [Nitrosomonas sp.]|nr:integrin alpha [Nitrosomonas sp.]